MGEEFGATTPFQFFCDFGPDLAKKVYKGRKEEFRKFEQFRGPEMQKPIPDPNDLSTFLASKLDWNSHDRGAHAEWLKIYRELLSVRRHKIVPILSDIATGAARFQTLGPKAMFVSWKFTMGGSLDLFANFGRRPVPWPSQPKGSPIYHTSDEARLPQGEMPAFSAAWFLNA
jgi:1,4-alpha-glucan branching enzyme